MRIDERIAAHHDELGPQERRAAATLLYVAPDAESRLEEARDSLSDAVCEAGASAWNGMLAVRLLSPDPDAVRQARGRFLARFRQAPPSRVW